MTSVAQSPALTRTGPSAPSHGQKLPVKPTKHKVVLESVTQEKKKLRSVLSFKAEPPTGYTFIPAGNPELTNALKEFARKGNHRIYAVSTTPHQKAHDLSQQVHRIGFHFPSVVVAQVCAHYGIVLTSAGTVLVEDEYQSFHPRSKRLNEQPAAEEPKDQITINTEARDTIRDLFPNIPDNDLNQIIKTAFQKGHGKVGTANELSLIRRAQLAVVAHIRHIYTDYDKLLRQTHYRDARNLVEKPTLRKLVEWRGDDENGKKVLEDVFREVVVISDDEDSSEDEVDCTKDFRDVSVEIVSSHTKADHLNPEPLVLEESLPGRRPGDFTPHNARRPTEYAYGDAPVQKKRPNDHDKSSRRGFSRYQAWNEAREEYRANPGGALAANQQTLTYSAAERPLRRPNMDLHSPLHQPETTLDASRASHQYHDIPVHIHDDPPETFRAEDGTLYERVLKYPSTRELQPPSRPLIYNPRSSAVEEQVRSFSTVDNAYLQNGSQTLASHRDTILPSIEGPQPAVGSSQFQTVSANHSSLQPTLERRTITYKNDNHRHVDDIEFLDLTEDDPPLKKRRRTDNIGYEMSPDYRNEVVTHKQPFQQRKLEYIPSVTRASERTVAPASTKQLSGLDHSHSHEFLSPSTPSSRIDDGFIPSRRLQSALPADQVVVDRGIQEYRAFRARERQERVPHSPKQGKMAQPHRNGGLTHRASESESGLLRQFDGADSSRNLSHHLLSPRVVSDFLSMNESLSLPREHEYPQTSEKVLQRIPPPPRRSASPDQYPRGRVSYVPVSSELQYRQHPRPVEHLRMDVDPVPQRGERQETVLVRPNQRYEQERFAAPQYVLLDDGDGQPHRARIDRYPGHF